MTTAGLYAGKNVFISGGSSGIGLACAKEFARLGSNVFIFARRREALEEAALSIEPHRADPSQRIGFTSVDVTDTEKVADKLRESVASFGPPHVVITCAGIAYPDYFERISASDFELTLRTNLAGTWNVLSVLVPLMHAKGGHVVTVSSIAGFLGVFGYTAYSASKFGVIGLSEALRAELKPKGIRVSVLCPPDTDTPGLAFENRTKPPETRALGKSAGLMSPDAVAKALVSGMARGKFLITPGMEGKLILAAKRLAPSVVMALMDAIVRLSRHG
ncbi:MAG TPA: SDR family oxidoreductase [Deltaproteobacteria bacterium]|nr:SDR family oxidoreductase [Deltaproteobacteria bacterium]HOM28218.1 SDR family oxidoreductase [Deltaproteobacteria bacterium]HPP81458.1 SDR family oxidoreductase [Deltaproteobacteria bacterium]